MKGGVKMSNFLGCDFLYDNQKGSDFGLSIVTIGSNDGLSSFGTNQSIIEQKLKTIDEPFFQGVSREPITIPLTFAILDNTVKWDYEKRSQIVNWLFQSDYKEFISEDNDSICYYLLATGESQRWDNGINNGYITISFRMRTPYAYTLKQEEKYEITQDNNVIELVNRSNIRDYRYYPIFEFIMPTDATSISFQNLSDGGKEINFTGLNGGEIIYLNNKTGEIISSTGLLRLSSCNRKWFYLTYGVNRVKVVCDGTGTNEIDLTVSMQFPVNF